MAATVSDHLNGILVVACPEHGRIGVTVEAARSRAHNLLLGHNTVHHPQPSPKREAS